MVYVTRDLGLEEVPTTGDLPSTASDGCVVVVLSPLALWARSGGSWIQIATPSGTPSSESPASESVAGVAELATQTEVDTGSDDARIVTPAKLANRTATETRAGLVEQATGAEVQAGTAGNLVATVARLKAELDRRLIPEAWIAPVLQNSWLNFGTPHEVAGYRKTSWGEVQLRGLIKSGTTTNNTVLFNLAAGYRPAATRNFVSVQGNNTACRVSVLSGGDVTINGVTDNTFLSLDVVRFDV